MVDTKLVIAGSVPIGGCFLVCEKSFQVVRHEEGRTIGHSTCEDFKIYVVRSEVEVRYVRT